VLLVLLLLTGSGGFIAISEQTSFCNSCHIMNPYYASWQDSGHSQVNCLECHVQPGLPEIVRAKLNGLAQTVDCLLGRVSSKPNALVEDVSCLRDGCHAKDSLLSEPVAYINQKYKFSHQGHVDAEMGGIRLLCTTCHSHFEGQEHFKVSTQVCFICHFLKNKTSGVRLAETKCRDCHDVPAESLKRGQAEIDHGKFVASQLSCEQLCHAKQVDLDCNVADVQCLDCHEFRNHGELGAADLHEAHAGKNKVECLACHEMIGHTASPIGKGHTSLKCDQSHQVPSEAAMLAEMESIKLPADCGLCHSDPHSGQFAKACQQCHSEHGWKGRWVADVHGEGAGFPLVGKHRAVECSRCHIGAKLAAARFTGLPKTCEQCHPDPHQGQMRASCDTCHSEEGWTGSNLMFSHNEQTSFSLEGPHSSLACDACHNPQEKRYRPLPHECGDCHKAQELAMQGTARTVQSAADFHGGRLSCLDCHDVRKAGQHLDEFAQRCTSCHNPHYGGLLFAWAGSFDKSRTLAEQALKEIADPNDPRRVQLERMVGEAREVGFHNLQLAQQIWKKATSAGQDIAKPE
jgi:nitrate/TMAO reductase-like tetraheme cytochrome c subunit